MTMHRDLIRHAGEFLRALRNRKYEMTDQGIYFSGARAFAHGEYFFDTNGQNHGVQSNLITVEGYNYLLEAGLRGQAAHGTWYLAIFGGAYTPTADLTGATFASAASELVSATTGYSENTRRPWNITGPAAQGMLSNVDQALNNKAAFTIRAPGELAIRGAALLSEPTKGGTTGVLLSASRFAVQRVHYNDDVFNLGWRVELVSA